MRGLTAATLVAASLLAPGASAKATSYAVYEVYQSRGGGPRRVPLRVELSSDGATTVFATMLFSPSNEGDAYRVDGMGVGTVNGTDTTWHTYGWPVTNPACPAAPLCGSPGKKERRTFTFTFEPHGETHLLVAGERGHLKVTSLSGAWRVRPSTAGFRVVPPSAADATGGTVRDVRYEVFRKASAPAGQYGSAAFAAVPCHVGQWRLHTESDSGFLQTCPLSFGFAFGDTDGARTWTVEGTTAGLYQFPFRLVVFDLPRYS